MTSDTRKDKRAKIVALTVRYKSATVDEFIDNHSFDVSMGGVFVKTPTPFAPGTLLKFELHIANDQTVIAGVGRVVWKREPTQAGGDRPAGMGVKFIKIDDASRQLIDRLVKENADAGEGFTSEEEEPPTAAQPMAVKPAAAAPAPKPAPAPAPAAKPAPPVATTPKPAPAAPVAKPAPAPGPPAPKPAPAPFTAPKPATTAAAATANLKATLPLASVPKPSAPPPRAAAPAPVPAPAPRPPKAEPPKAEPPKAEPPKAEPAAAEGRSDSIRPVDPRRQTVAGLGVPIGLASQGKEGPSVSSTQPLGTLSSEDDEAFSFLDDLEQKDPVPAPAPVAAPVAAPAASPAAASPTSKSYPSPFDQEPATNARPSRSTADDPWAQTLMDSPQKPSPDESAGYSSTQPLAKSALPDFDAAIAAAAPQPQKKDFERTMPLDRASLGLPDAPPPAAAGAGAMFPKDTGPSGGGAMFPKTTSGPSSFDGDRPEPTVMKQAAELLEEALREAGGSLDEIGHNPLFQNANVKAEGPTVAQGPSDDLLAAVRGTDGPGHDDPTVMRFGGETPTVPAFTPEVPPRNSGTPAPAPVALALATANPAAPAQDFAQLPPEQAPGGEDQVRPLPVSKKRSGGGGVAVLVVLLVTLLTGGGVWAYKTHAFGLGAPPDPAPPPPPTASAPSAEPDAAPVAATDEAGTDEAGAAAAGGDASTSDAAPATSASAATSAAASASAPPPEKPKPVYRPPPPPKPTEPTEPTTTPTSDPKPPSLDPKPDPKPEGPKPTEAPKPTETPKTDPKPSEVN